MAPVWMHVVPPKFKGWKQFLCKGSLVKFVGEEHCGVGHKVPNHSTERKWYHYKIHAMKGLLDVSPSWAWFCPD